MTSKSDPVKGKKVSKSNSKEKAYFDETRVTSTMNWLMGTLIAACYIAFGMTMIWLIVTSGGDVENGWDDV